MKNEINLKPIIGILFFITIVVWALCPISFFTVNKKAHLAINEARFNAFSLAISAYYDHYHALPNSLSILRKDCREIRWIDGFNDAWDKPFIFDYNNGKEIITLTSFGKDGKLSGTGINTDWIYQHSVENEKVKKLILSKYSND
jgi:hypothetical protein